VPPLSEKVGVCHKEKNTLYSGLSILFGFRHSLGTSPLDKGNYILVGSHLYVDYKTLISQGRIVFTMDCVREMRRFWSKGTWFQLCELNKF
jgi:hypothetical protein